MAGRGAFFGQRAKDFQKCLKNIHTFTDGQAAMIDWDSDGLTFLTVQLKPNNGLYEGGCFDFRIGIPDRYPEEAPKVTCLTNIYHPNINLECSCDYNVCFSLFDEWQDARNGLEDVINGLLYLLNYPNLDDPWPSFFDTSMSNKVLTRNIKRSLAGMKLEYVDLVFNKFIEYDAEKYDCDSDAEDENDEEENQEEEEKADEQNSTEETEVETTEPSTEEKTDENVENVPNEQVEDCDQEKRENEEIKMESEQTTDQGTSHQHDNQVAAGIEIEKVPTEQVGDSGQETEEKTNHVDVPDTSNHAVPGENIETKMECEQLTDQATSEQSGSQLTAGVNNDKVEISGTHRTSSVTSVEVQDDEGKGMENATDNSLSNNNDASPCLTTEQTVTNPNSANDATSTHTGREGENQQKEDSETNKDGDSEQPCDGAEPEKPTEKTDENEETSSHSENVNNSEQQQTETEDGENNAPASEVNEVCNDSQTDANKHEEKKEPLAISDMLDKLDNLIDKLKPEDYKDEDGNDPELFEEEKEEQDEDDAQEKENMDTEPPAASSETTCASQSSERREESSTAEASVTEGTSSSSSGLSLSRQDTKTVADIHEEGNIAKTNSKLTRMSTFNATRQGTKQCIDLNTLLATSPRRCLTSIVALSRQETAQYSKLSSSLSRKRSRSSDARPQGSRTKYPRLSQTGQRTCYPSLVCSILRKKTTGDGSSGDAVNSVTEKLISGCFSYWALLDSHLGQPKLDVDSIVERYKNNKFL